VGHKKACVGTAKRGKKKQSGRARVSTEKKTHIYTVKLKG